MALQTSVLGVKTLHSMAGSSRQYDKGIGVRVGGAERQGNVIAESAICDACCTYSVSPTIVTYYCHHGFRV